MSKKRDYYEVLGIENTATTDQIKKAYKKLAIKWHPDKNPNNKQQANQKFREICEAYQILSDESKRKNYDAYGFDGPKFQGLGGGFGSFHFTDADSIFKDFFSKNGFDDDEDRDFFSMFRNRGGKNSGFGSFGSAFDDDFFSKGFGSSFGTNNFGGGGFSSFSSSSFGGGGGVSKSVSTTTKTVNGKTVTTKKTTIVKPDGTKEVSEEIIDANGNRTQNKYIGNTQDKKSVKN